MKLTLVWLLAATVAMAGCVMPEDLMNQETPEEESVEAAQADKRSPPTIAERKERKITMPEAPEFHEAASILEFAGDDALTGVDVRSSTGSIYIAPHDGDGWFVEAGLVQLDGICQSTGNAEEAFEVVAEVVDGVLTVELVWAQSSGMTPMGDLISMGSEWADVKVYAPIDVAGITLGYPEDTERSYEYRGITFGWCGMSGWGHAVHGFESDSLEITGVNTYLDARALRVTDVTLTNANGGIHVMDSVFGGLTATTANGKISLMEITTDSLVATSSNGRIMVEDVDALEAVLSTSNAAVEIELAEKAAGLWTVSTSNGKVAIKAPTKKDYGYDVVAETSNAAVDVKLPDFVMEEEEDSFVKGTTEDFDTRMYRYILEVESSNGRINIG